MNARPSTPIPVAAPPESSALPFSACVLVPAFQAEATCGNVVRELRRVLPEIRPLFVIDDGSDDRTASVAEEAGATVLRHPKNLGKGAALLSGLRAAERAGIEVALTVDADGQHPAESAREVLSALSDGRHAPDALVLGVRDLVRDGAPRANQLSNGISNFFLSRFAGLPLLDTQCGLRRYPVRATLDLGARADGYAFEAEVILRAIAAGIPVVQQPVAVYYPPEEERITHFHRVRDPARIIATVLRTLYDLRARPPRKTSGGER